MLNNATDPLNQLDLKTRIIIWFFSQGLGVVVMAVGLYILYQERREERLSSQSCNERLIELAQQQTIIMAEIRQHFKQEDTEAAKPTRRK